jgi:RNA polymerase sigma-70 factor (ECF subfamily)
MYRIARNVRIDHYSKRKRSVADGTDFDGLAGENPSPHLEAERSQNHALLLRALSQLSSDEREAVLLSRFDGMKYQEISQIQNCAEGTIKARMHHAMKKLQANFKQLAGDPE